VALIILTAAAVLLAAFAALYSYGRFAHRGHRTPSSALPVRPGETRLDTLVAPLAARRPGESGLMLLADNLDAFAIRALTARHAGRSLDLQYYMWRNDLTGWLLAGEVVRAADRGVRVRVLLDDINAHGQDAIYRALDAHPNIEIRLFNPSQHRENALHRGLEMLVRGMRLTRRMHNKAWIADGRVAMLGGRNIGDAYFDADRTANFRDLDVLVLGAAVPQAEAVFDAFWNSRAAVPVAALAGRRRAELPALAATLAALGTRPEAAPYLERIAADDTRRALLAGKRRLHWTAEARVVSDPPRKVRRAGQTRWLITEIRPLLASAATAIELISPYFIPGRRGSRLLLERARRGVAVSVLTNSLAATDVMAVHGAYARWRRHLLADGIRIFELKPYDRRSGRSLFGSSGASLHTKAFTVDGRIGFVGSMNFDPRGIALNTEMGVIFTHRGLAREIGAIFAEETAPQASYRLRLAEGAVQWQDDAATPPAILHAEPEASPWRRLAAWTIGLLPIESQL